MFLSLWQVSQFHPSLPSSAPTSIIHYSHMFFGLHASYLTLQCCHVLTVILESSDKTLISFVSKVHVKFILSLLSSFLCLFGSREQHVWLQRFTSWKEFWNFFLFFFTGSINNSFFSSNKLFCFFLGCSHRGQFNPPNQAFMWGEYLRFEL